MKWRLEHLRDRNKDRRKQFPASGTRISRLVILEESFPKFIRKKEHPKYHFTKRTALCRCDCGQLVIKLLSELFRVQKRGTYRSCGCRIGFIHPTNKLRSPEELRKDLNAATRRHYQSHQEQEITRRKQWKKDNPEKVRLHDYRKALKRRNATGAHSAEEWSRLKKMYGYMCPYCKRFEPEIKLTKDHIIPLSKGGTDHIGNIQPLCHSCNSRKGAKIDDNFETWLWRFNIEDEGTLPLFEKAA